MTFGELNAALQVVDLSPEQLAPYFGLGNMTIRRWRDRPSSEKVPLAYERALVEGIYKLVLEGMANGNDPALLRIIESFSSLSFEAIIKTMGVPESVAKSKSSHQDKMMIALSKIGWSEDHRKLVDSSQKETTRFQALGAEWKSRISSMTAVIRSKNLTKFDKMVAYGALFYLITPFDLIPDHIPVLGLIDDFGVLGFAVAFYAKRFPELVRQ